MTKSEALGGVRRRALRIRAAPDAAPIAAAQRMKASNAALPAPGRPARSASRSAGIGIAFVIGLSLAQSAGAVIAELALAAMAEEAVFSLIVLLLVGLGIGAALAFAAFDLARRRGLYRGTALRLDGS